MKNRLYKISIKLNTEGLYEKIDSATIDRVTPMKYMLSRSDNTLHRLLVSKREIGIPVSTHFNIGRDIEHSTFYTDITKEGYYREMLMEKVNEDFSILFNGVMSMKNHLKWDRRKVND